MGILANAWAASGHEVHLFTLEGPGAVPFFRLDPGVQFHPLGHSLRSVGLRQKITNNLARIRNLRRALARIQPDLMVSFIDKANILALLGCLGLGIPGVVSERSDPAISEIGLVWEGIRLLVYPLASGVVVQVPSVRDFFPGWLQDRIWVIPNPVPTPVAGPPALEPRPRILAAGRLHREKGFDLLLEAFARTRHDHPEWRLDIAGEGEERAALEAQVARLGLAGACRLLGIRQDLAAQMRACDLFVLSSRSDGFPNVLCEAMALGTAVISFDCPSGPAHIIRHGLDGLLVPPERVDGLAGALGSLMGDAALRARLASRAPEVLERFSEPVILAQWDECLRAATARRARRIG